MSLPFPSGIARRAWSSPGLPSAQLDGLRAQGIEPVFSAPDHGEGIHVLSHDRYFTPPVFPGLPRFQINDRAMLYLIPAGLEMELPRLKLHALFHGVPRVALAAGPRPSRRRRRRRGATPRRSAPIALVQQIVDATSQASWFQFVRDLSGDSDVTIPGFCTNCRIRTRASNYMFPLNNTGTPLGNPFATEYLENKAAGWGFTGAERGARELHLGEFGLHHPAGLADLAEPRLHAARPGRLRPEPAGHLPRPLRHHLGERRQRRQQRAGRGRRDLGRRGAARGDAAVQGLRLAVPGEIPVRQRRGGRAVRLHGLHPHAPGRARCGACSTWIRPPSTATRTA